MIQTMIEEVPGTIADELQRSILHEPVSSVVQLIEWNPSSQALRVTLTSGAVFDYPGVSRQRVQDFMDAPSKGAYFSANFRGKS